MAAPDEAFRPTKIGQHARLLRELGYSQKKIAALVEARIVGFLPKEGETRWKTSAGAESCRACSRSPGRLRHFGAARTRSGGSARLTGGRISVCVGYRRVAELATPDYKQMAYADAWFWATRLDALSSAESAGNASKEAFRAITYAARPDAVFMLLTHDHGDHIGDYFDALKALVDAASGLTAGQAT